MSHLTPASQLAAHAKTPFPGASAEYDRARKALLEIIDTGSAPSPDKPADEALSLLIEDAKRLAGND